MSEQPTYTEPPVDYKKWLHEMQRQDAQRAHDSVDDFFKQVNAATIANGTLAVRTALLINGGAAAAVLAFVGGLVSQGRIGLPQLADITSSLMWFTWGVALAATATGLSYFTNYCIGAVTVSRTKIWKYPYVEDGPNTKNWRFAGYVFQGLSIATALLSLVLFIVGMIDVKNSVSRLPPPQTTQTGA